MIKKIFLSLVGVITIVLIVMPNKNIEHHTFKLLRSTDWGIHVIKYLDKNEAFRKEALPPLAPPELAQDLYQLMKDVHDAMEICGAEYWIDAGTLLGAVRHKGLIPWDDDLDIHMHDDSRPILFEKVVPILKGLGYEYEEVIGEKYEIYKIEYPNRNGDTHSPALDIIFVKERNGILVQKGWDATIKLDDWKPFKLYDFGPYQVWGTKNPIPYLDDMYGKSWREIAYRGFDHINKDAKNASKKTFVMKDGQYQPAPWKPLKDNRQKIKSLYKKLFGN